MAANLLVDGRKAPTSKDEKSIKSLRGMEWVKSVLLALERERTRKSAATRPECKV